MAHKTHIVKLTEAQNNALPALMDATGKNKAELIRYALALIAAQHDIEFPDDMLKRGEWKQIDKIKDTP